MKIFDLIKLSLKNLKGRWALFPIIGIAISAFCLCFAGVILITVQEEKSIPYEIIISSEGNSGLSDNMVAEIAKLDSVVSISPVYQIPVIIKTDEYLAQLTLTGINAGYLKEGYSQGNSFPENSIMPYIVLNEAAQKKFSKKSLSSEKSLSNDNSGTENTESESASKLPEIGWLNANFTMQLSEDGKAVVSKVCGILATEDNKEKQEPAAYVSLSVAKSLFQKSEQGNNYAAIHVRVKNIGEADDVSKSLLMLGLTVSNSTSELQAGWDIDTKEMVYLITIGAFCLVCATVLIAASRQISSLKQEKEWEALRWMGMRQKDIHRLFAIQGIMISIIGTALGIVVAAALPSFLSSEEPEATNFLLQTPVEIIAITASICLLLGQLPLWIKNKIS
jgi:ribosomal protein S11